MRAKFAGRCVECGGAFAAGDEIHWNRELKKARHLSCEASAVPRPRQPSIPPTPEQVNALDLFATGENLAIEAGAGTGKTTTLRILAESTPRRGQYVAFNKAIVVESREKMPPNMECNTAHSLAYRAVGKKYQARLHNSKRMHSTKIANILGLQRIVVPDLDGSIRPLSEGYLAGLVMRMIIRFCQSADLEIAKHHKPYIDGIDPLDKGRRTYANNDLVAQYILPYAERAWEDLMSPSGILPFRHDHYLKAWQLQEPKINSDFILFDEAQDANPVMNAIITAQEHAQIVWVGDSQQQIYGFTGAINALSAVPAENRAFLTQSFRFGWEIADHANEILGALDADLELRGLDSIDSIVHDIETPNAYLTRTNAAAVRAVMHYQELGLHPHLVGGGTDVVRFAKGADDLMLRGVTDHPELACFRSWGEVKAYVKEDEQGDELKLMVTLVDDFGVPTILEALEHMVPEASADVVVSTAHKAKGREWGKVQLGGDFPPEAEKDELRLLYVAVTRAKYELDVSSIYYFNKEVPW